MDRILLVLVISVFAIFSCNTKTNTKEIQSIEIETAVLSVEDFGLSAISNKISYIALETTDSSLIGQDPDISVWNDKIVVSSRLQPLLVFDRKDGHFLNSIGHYGDDPQGLGHEGSGYVPFWIDQTNGIVYLRTLDNRGLLRYGIDGNYLGKITFNFGKYKALDIPFCSLYISNETIYVHNKYIQLAEDPLLIAFNAITGDIISAIPSFMDSPLPTEIIELYIWGNSYTNYGGMEAFVFKYAYNQILQIVPSSPSLWEYKGKIHLKEAFIDTIFNVETSSLTPFISLDLGKFSWPYNKRLEGENSRKYIFIDYILENETMIYFHLHSGLYEGKDNSQVYCGIYHKPSLTTHVMKGDIICDDINHFLPLTIRGVTPDGDFIGLIQISEIINWNKKITIVDNPEIESLRYVHEEDNPVVAFIKRIGNTTERL